MPRLLLLLVLLLAASTDALAQRPARDVVAYWVRQQSDAARPLASVEVDERATWQVDGRRGASRIEQRARVRARPREDVYERDVVDTRVDGRPHRGHRGGPPMRHLLDPGLERFGARLLLPLGLVRELRPAAPPMRVEDDGRPQWRVDLVPERPRHPVERATLWFDADEGRLVQSRLLVHAPGDPHVVTTRYRRVEGLDLPSERRLEGTLTTRRRARTFTVLFALETRYDDYRLTFDR